MCTTMKTQEYVLISVNSRQHIYLIIEWLNILHIYLRIYISYIYIYVLANTMPMWNTKMGIYFSFTGVSLPVWGKFLF